MKIAGMIMAATAALSIIGSSAFAEQMRDGNGDQDRSDQRHHLDQGYS